MLFSAKQRQLEAAKIILCASAKALAKNHHLNCSILFQENVLHVKSVTKHILTLFTLKLAFYVSFHVPCKHTLCHTFVTNVALFNCVYISNVLLQNICCVELSITDVTVGLVFLVVFSVVLAETTSTAEFFSTIGTLVFNVHGSKSRSQLKNSTTFKRVSTIDF